MIHYQFLAACGHLSVVILILNCLMEQSLKVASVLFGEPKVFAMFKDFGYHRNIGARYSKIFWGLP